VGMSHEHTFMSANFDSPFVYFIFYPTLSLSLTGSHAAEGNTPTLLMSLRGHMTIANAVVHRLPGTAGACTRR
jgi:hypothetical protein